MTVLNFTTRRASLVRAVAALLLSCCAAEAAKAAEQAPRTEHFSLQLDASGQTLPDWFPMGFVRGDPAVTAGIGFSQVQDTSMAPAFVQGESYPAPPLYQQDPWNLRYFSMALAADSLHGLVTAAGMAGLPTTAKTAAFGALSLATGPDGQPYALPPEATRDLAKARDLVDVFDPVTRHYLMAYVKAHVESRVKAPNGAQVQLWGLDNEWEAPPNYSPVARGLFLAWLKDAYANDIGSLNAAWDTHYRAFDASVAATPPAPEDYKDRPGAFLDWHAFSTEYFLQLLLEQARTMHAADPLRRGVVHKATQLTIGMPATSRLRLFDHGRFAELVRPYSGGLYAIDMYGAGDRQAYETSYIHNSIRPEDRAPGHGVMLAETNNHDGPGHQFASTFWRLLSNGAKSAMFFTPGFAGSPQGSDWDTYAMLERATGRPTERWFYAARWAAAVHRSERFWSQAVPAPELPRVALLMPRRDVLLAESSTRNPGEGRFAYARNHQWMVYRWLREQGYWVDVLPYEKLTDAYLAPYQALLLVGAEHLAARETAAVQRYVGAGGVLVGDSQPGYFDEHHRVVKSLADPTGLATTRESGLRRVAFDIAGRGVAGVTAFALEAGSAQVLARAADGSPLALLQAFGEGRILSLPFELGSLELVAAEVAVAATATTVEPTAGPEQYAAHADEFLPGDWLAGQLAEAGLQPAYVAAYADAAARRIVRVEQPYRDAAGNVAVVIGNRAQAQPQELLPAGAVELPLPEGSWTQAYWSAAETNALQTVSVAAVGDGRYRVELPAIASAGILYLFNRHEPLLGIAPLASDASAVDGHTARVKPGEPFSVPVQVANANAGSLASGALTLKVPPGWTVAPAELGTPPLAAGAMATLEFTVTPPADGTLLRPDRLYPLTARWHDGQADRAIITTHVEAAPAAADSARLLTGNAAWPGDYPWRLDTGATYRYLSPLAALIKDPAAGGTAVAPGQALLGGFGSVGGERDSFNRGGYVPNFYARYGAPVVEVVFDLQAPRNVMRVHVSNGPERVLPEHIEVFTSEDGDAWALAAQIAVAEPMAETIVSLPSVRARWVKLHIAWPGAGGTLDEVEIWGR